jgi:hypothetical protein
MEDLGVGVEKNLRCGSHPWHRLLDWIGEPAPHKELPDTMIPYLQNSITAFRMTGISGISEQRVVIVGEREHPE